MAPARIVSNTAARENGSLQYSRRSVAAIITQIRTGNYNGKRQSANSLAGRFFKAPISYQLSRCSNLHLAKKILDPYRETKRNRDLAVIRDLFSVFPCPLVDTVLTDALSDRILTDHIDCLETAEKQFRSTLFQLYDKTLHELLTDFFRNWNLVWDLGETTHDDHLHIGVAKLILQDTDSSNRWQEHADYIDQVKKAQGAMARLTKHLYETYPDFDLSESDQEAYRKYFELVQHVESKTKQMWGECKSDHTLLHEESPVPQEAGNVQFRTTPLHECSPVATKNYPNGRTAELIKVLLLSANPIDSPLNIDEEFRLIDQKIRSSEHRDHVHLIQHGAVRLEDMGSLLMRHKPHVVHFSGHGATTGIVLAGPNGEDHLVPPDALTNIFRALKDNVRVVLLNACDSAKQAEAIVSEIDCAVGMSDKIGDDAAIAFAAAFYETLAYGQSVQTAFDLALVQLEGAGEERSLAKLYKRRTVKPSEIILVNPQNPQ